MVCVIECTRMSADIAAMDVRTATTETCRSIRIRTITSSLLFLFDRSGCVQPNVATSTTSFICIVSIVEFWRWRAREKKNKKKLKKGGEQTMAIFWRYFENNAKQWQFFAVVLKTTANNDNFLLLFWRQRQKIVTFGEKRQNFAIVSKKKNSHKLKSLLCFFTWKTSIESK